MAEIRQRIAFTTPPRRTTALAPASGGGHHENLLHPPRGRYHSVAAGHLPGLDRHRQARALVDLRYSWRWREHRRRPRVQVRGFLPEVHGHGAAGGRTGAVEG